MQSASHENVFLLSLGGVSSQICYWATKSEPRTEHNNVDEHLRTSDSSARCFYCQFQETDSEHVTSWTSVGASAIQHKQLISLTPQGRHVNVLWHTFADGSTVQSVNLLIMLPSAVDHSRPRKRSVYSIVAARSSQTSVIFFTYTFLIRLNLNSALFLMSLLNTINQVRVGFEFLLFFLPNTS